MTDADAAGLDLNGVLSRRAGDCEKLRLRDLVQIDGADTLAVEIDIGNGRVGMMKVLPQQRRA